MKIYKNSLVKIKKQLNLTQKNRKTIKFPRKK